MNTLIFTGRLAAAPELRTHGNTKLARLRLIRNEYAGKDEHGERRERVVTLPFTAFGPIAERLAAHSLPGDQLLVRAAIRNNHYIDGNGIEHYDYNFDIEHVEFGAPGTQKRKRLAESGT